MAGDVGGAGRADSAGADEGAGRLVALAELALLVAQGGSVGGVGRAGRRKRRPALSTTTDDQLRRHPDD